MAIRVGKIELVVEPETQAIRLDSYVGSHTQDISRSTLSDKDTIIVLNGKTVKKSKLVKAGDTIQVTYSQEVFEGIIPQNIALTVLYEDEDLLIINKEQGMVVHPANGNYEGTLVNALAYRYGQAFCDEMGEDDDEETVNTSLRPGIVHRLDKDTSGVLVVARNRFSHRNLSEQFKERSTTKIYIALAKGTFKEKIGLIEKHLKRDPKDRKKFTTCSDDEGRNAKTAYQVLRQYKGFALLRITLFTGRTHQIRVHLKDAGHPLVGDPIYGKQENVSLMLHALSLQVTQPSTGEAIHCTAPMPERFLSYMKATRHPANSGARSR